LTNVRLERELFRALHYAIGVGLSVDLFEVQAFEHARSRLSAQGADWCWLRFFVKLIDLNT